MSAVLLTQSATALSQCLLGWRHTRSKIGAAFLARVSSASGSHNSRPCCELTHTTVGDFRYHGGPAEAFWTFWRNSAALWPTTSAMIICRARYIRKNPSSRHQLYDKVIRENRRTPLYNAGNFQVNKWVSRVEKSVAIGRYILTEDNEYLEVVVM